MSDEMDPCECLWNQEMAMRRLISMLRQGQAYCTDTECLDSIPTVPGASAAGSSFLVLFLTLAFAVAMYALRPRTRQAITHEPAKPARHQEDQDDGAPPTPPRV